MKFPIINFRFFSFSAKLCLCFYAFVELALAARKVNVRGNQFARTQTTKIYLLWWPKCARIEYANTRVKSFVEQLKLSSQKKDKKIKIFKIFPLCFALFPDDWSTPISSYDWFKHGRSCLIKWTKFGWGACIGNLDKLKIRLVTACRGQFGQKIDSRFMD